MPGWNGRFDSGSREPFLVSMYDELELHFFWANLPLAFVYLCKEPA